VQCSTSSIFLDFINTKICSFISIFFFIHFLHKPQTFKIKIKKTQKTKPSSQTQKNLQKIFIKIQKYIKSHKIQMILLFLMILMFLLHILNLNKL
jgi:hypothetical protein